jgi:hypothetical protein
VPGVLLDLIFTMDIKDVCTEQWRAKTHREKVSNFGFAAEVFFMFLSRKILFKETETGHNSEPAESNTRVQILAVY